MVTAKPSTIVFDIFFSEEDKQNPTEIVKSYKIDKESNFEIYEPDDNVTKERKESIRKLNEDSNKQEKENSNNYSDNTTYSGSNTNDHLSNCIETVCKIVDGSLQCFCAIMGLNGGSDNTRKTRFFKPKRFKNKTMINKKRIKTNKK
jgi:hypothetical protein